MKKLGYILMVLVMLMVTSPAKSLTIEFDYELYGSSLPEGTSPWITATFEDTAVTGVVQLTITATGLVETTQYIQYISQLYFNLDPNLNPELLTFTMEGSSPTVPVPVLDTGINEFHASGDGLYDILFTFPPPPGIPGGGDYFTQGEVLIYNISYPDGVLTPESFNAISYPFVDAGRGEFLAAALVNDTAVAGSFTAWIAAEQGTPVPEPGTLMLLGSGLIGVVVFRRKFKK